MLILIFEPCYEQIKIDKDRYDGWSQQLTF